MATVPFEYDCDKESGFVLDPNLPRRVGYLVALDGFGLPARLAANLQVHVPFNAGAVPSYKALNYTPLSATAPQGLAKVVGVIERFRWSGGVGDAIMIDFYVSQENASQIRSLQQVALKTTQVKALAWWIADYDLEVKKWFEQAYPLGTTGAVTGLIAGKDNPELNVDLNPVVVKDGIDVNVYKVSISVVPAGNLSYTLQFAASAQKRVAKAWGLAVGTPAKGAAS